jgi:hypothetical protein
LTNARSLGRYLVEHKHEISHIAGIVPAGRKKNNRELYHVIELPDDPTN